MLTKPLTFHGGDSQTWPSSRVITLSAALWDLLDPAVLVELGFDLLGLWTGCQTPQCQKLWPGNSWLTEYRFFSWCIDRLLLLNVKMDRDYISLGSMMPLCKDFIKRLGLVLARAAFSRLDRWCSVVGLSVRVSVRFYKMIRYFIIKV